MSENEVEAVRFDAVRGKHVLVALSGGADSVCLLYLLAGAREACCLYVTAAHFNHGIRGAEADADAAFCEALCKALDVPLIRESADVPAIARAKKVGLETAARELRYQFLRKSMKACGADCISLAHHLDDQAETLLMHLLRGCGPEGACGMSEFSGDLYRPLLSIRKRALEDYLRRTGRSWRVDSTNAQEDTPRNALRLNVLPEIEKSYPAAAEALARFVRLEQIESAYLAEQTRAYLSENAESGPYGTRLKTNALPHEAVLRRALRTLCPLPLDFAETDALLELIAHARGRLELGGRAKERIRIERTPEALYFLPEAARACGDTARGVPLKIPGETVLEGLCRISACEAQPVPETMRTDEQVLDADALQGAVLRTRRAGDRIYPLGAPGGRLLSDYLTDKKLDRPLRDYLPLIASGGNILWACGLGISGEARLTERTRRAVRLRLISITNDKAEV